MNKDKFAKRYFDFWMNFHPGLKIPIEIVESANSLYEKISQLQVEYEFIDEILSGVEHDWKEWPYSFNLYAIVADYIRVSKLDDLVNAETFAKKPIDLPPGKKFDTAQEMLIKKQNEFLEDSVKELIPEWLSIVRKINAKRSAGQFNQSRGCWACLDSGWIYVENNKVATCTCPRGQRIKDTKGNKIHLGDKLYVKEATIQDCKIAALKNGEPSGILAGLPAATPF